MSLQENLGSSKMKDQTTQQSNQIKFNTFIKNNSLLIEYNDGFNYQATLESFPLIDLEQIKQIIDSGEAKIISKTYTKVRIRIMVIILDLYNEEHIHIQRLNKKVEEIEEKLKAPQWEEEDLNSTGPFDINYHYKLILNNTYSVICTYVDQNGLYYFYNNNTSYNTQRTNRKASSIGHVVNKILRQRIIL